MKNVVGIRRESADATERRAPLSPAQTARLVREYGLTVVVQPSRLRAFSDEEYAESGAEISEDLSECNVLLGVREIAIEHVWPGAVYCFFSHTVKAQRYNMPMLRHMLESGCTLIDYELVTNDAGSRLLFAGDFAGYAGMVDALWGLGRKLESVNIASPFGLVKQSLEYDGLAEAESAVSRVGAQIRSEGLPERIAPVVFGFTGAGHASRAAQRICNLLPTVAITPDDLSSLASSGAYSRNAVYRVVFRKPDLYAPFDGEAAFDPDEFDRKPGAYHERFHEFAPYLSVLVNAISWSSRYPRLLTRGRLGAAWSHGEDWRLRVISDVACDIEGSIEFTVRHSLPSNPAYVFEPATGRIVNGFSGSGPVVLSSANLPAKFPREASEAFGNALISYVPALAAADFTVPFADLDVPAPFARAVIAHRGALTGNFRYLNEYLL